MTKNYPIKAKKKWWIDVKTRGLFRLLMTLILRKHLMFKNLDSKINVCHGKINFSEKYMSIDISLELHQKYNRVAD